MNRFRLERALCRLIGTREMNSGKGMISSTFAESCIDDAIMHIEEFLKEMDNNKTEWINAKDREAPKDPPSLIRIEDGSFHVGYPILKEFWQEKSKWIWEIGGWESCNYCGGINEIVFKNPCIHQVLATHWMPLPQPPDLSMKNAQDQPPNNQQITT